jgi:hypothetical protein
MISSLHRFPHEKPTAVHCTLYRQTKKNRFHLFIHLFIHLLYSINPSVATDTSGCGTCQNSIYSIAKHNHFTLHIDIDTYDVSGSGRYLYHYYAL